jgi:hypothetical protein
MASLIECLVTLAEFISQRYSVISRRYSVMPVSPLGHYIVRLVRGTLVFVLAGCQY